MEESLTHFYVLGGGGAYKSFAQYQYWFLKHQPIIPALFRTGILKNVTSNSKNFCEHYSTLFRPGGTPPPKKKKVLELLS